MLWGIALGVIVYRYAMLPFDWHSTWKMILPGAAIGLAVGARQLVLDDGSGRTRPPLPMLLGVGVVGVALAFGICYLAFPTLNRASIERRDFGGFSLEVPSGDVIENRTEYTSGKLALKNVGGHRGAVIVQWELGGKLSPQELELTAGLMGKALGTQGTSQLGTVPGPDGKPVDSIMFGDDKATLAMSMLTCGVRHVFVVTGGPDDSLGLHKRIVASFTCKPDPAKEGTAQFRFPLLLELPDWYVAERDIDQIAITNGVTGHMTLRALPAGTKTDLAMLIEPMFKAAGVEAKITNRVGDRISVHLTDGADSMDGWATLIQCPDATAMVLAIGIDQSSLDELYNRVTSARCLRPGEPMQEWPAAPSGAPAPP